MSHKSSVIKNSEAGFTFIEVVLALALITVLLGIALPVYGTFLSRNNLDVSAGVIAQSFRRAQILSQAMEGDNTWGVFINASTVTIFKGSSFGTRDASVDEVFNLPGGITPSGPNALIFNKLTGLPQSTGNIILTSSTNDTATISINSKGLVSY